MQRASHHLVRLPCNQPYNGVSTEALIYPDLKMTKLSITRSLLPPLMRGGCSSRGPAVASVSTYRLCKNCHPARDTPFVEGLEAAPQDDMLGERKGGDNEKPAARAVLPAVAFSFYIYTTSRNFSKTRPFLQYIRYYAWSSAFPCSSHYGLGT